MPALLRLASYERLQVQTEKPTVQNQWCFRMAGHRLLAAMAGGVDTLTFSVTRDQRALCVRSAGHVLAKPFDPATYDALTNCATSSATSVEL